MNSKSDIRDLSGKFEKETEITAKTRDLIQEAAARGYIYASRVNTDNFTLENYTDWEFQGMSGEDRLENIRMRAKTLYLVYSYHDVEQQVPKSALLMFKDRSLAVQVQKEHPDWFRDDFIAVMPSSSSIKTSDAVPQASQNLDKT